MKEKGKEKMKRIKLLSTIVCTILLMITFHSFANANTVGEEKIQEEQIKPSEEFKIQTEASDKKVMARVASNTTYTSGNYQYKIEENYRITATNVSNIIISDHTEDIAIITKYTGNEANVTIPAALGGKRVYKIEEAAFYQNTSINKLVILDNTVGYIGQGAFANCTNLKEVSLGNSVNNISYYAFQNTAITEIKIPASLETIRSTTFYHCEKLTNITIDNKNVHFAVIDSVIYELDSAENREMILYPYAKTNTTFTVADKVKSIASEAIINPYLETINIPASVNNIALSSYALTTPKLRAINVNSANSIYSSINGVLFSKDKKTIYLYPAGRTDISYQIPSGTTNIAKDAFYNTSYLKQIIIPNTVTNIETEGFGYAKGLEEITIPSSVKEFGAQLFVECPNLRKVTISANAEVLSYLTFRECESLEEVIVNGNIKTIIKGAFYYCPKLTKVTLPNSLERINFGAFWDCRGLKNITIPKNVVLIEECAFYEHLNANKDYWSDTNFDISQTQLKKQSDGNYMAAYEYSVKGTRDYEKAYAVLDMVNQERKKIGLKELTMDKELLETAMQRASETVTYFEHERPSGLDFASAIKKVSYSAAGENIAKYQTTANSVMNSWMNSPGHRQNILTSYFTCIGIGCYRADDGQYYWTQIFTNGDSTVVTKPENEKTTEKIRILRNRIPFYDVKITDWHYDAVKYSVVNKMILGYNSTTFSPESKLTRGMLVTILHRMEGSPYVAGESKFSDVQDTNAYYYVAVKWASTNHIVSGYDDKTFGPEDNITREQLAVILNKYCKYKGKYKAQENKLKQFSDANQISSFAKWEMQWATGAGVITGTSKGTLNPQGTATRAEVASMLYKYDNQIGR